MTRRVPVVEKITKANDQIAAENKARLDKHGIVGLNLMASPGAGKTSLIEQTVPRLAAKLRLGVIEGDIATSLDAERVAEAGAVSVQINTGGACHLDANMVREALDQLSLADLDLLIIENVGNLICPAGFKLGTHRTVLLASVPEGDDKPVKHPAMYSGYDVLVVNKIDLLPYVDFDMALFEQRVEALNRGVEKFQISCRSGEGVDDWVQWLVNQKT